MGLCKCVHWPEDLNTLAGQCGHLFHEGRRPSVCDAGRAVTFALRRTLNRSESTGPQRPWTLPSLSAGVALWGKPVLFWMSVLLSLPATSGVRQSAESYDDEVAVAPEYDSSPACSHAWSHELACQTTHFHLSILNYGITASFAPPLSTPGLQSGRPSTAPRCSTTGVVIPLLDFVSCSGRLGTAKRTPFCMSHLTP